MLCLPTNLASSVSTLCEWYTVHGVLPPPYAANSPVVIEGKAGYPGVRAFTAGEKPRVVRLKPLLEFGSKSGKRFCPNRTVRTVLGFSVATALDERPST